MDTFYFAPSGKKFRSRAEVARWHGCAGAPETNKSRQAGLKRKASAADAAGPLQAGDAADAQAADAQAADAQAAAAERASAAGATQVDGLAPGDQGSGNGASSSHFVSSFGRGETALVLARKAAGELRQLQAMRAKLEKALAREKEKRETSR
jgi:hypothetical protein